MAAHRPPRISHDRHNRILARPHLRHLRQAAHVIGIPCRGPLAALGSTHCHMEDKLRPASLCKLPDLAQVSLVDRIARTVFGQSWPQDVTRCRRCFRHGARPLPDGGHRHPDRRFPLRRRGIPLEMGAVPIQLGATPISMALVPIRMGAPPSSEEPSPFRWAPLPARWETLPSRGRAPFRRGSVAISTGAAPDPLAMARRRLPTGRKRFPDGGIALQTTRDATGTRRLAARSAGEKVIKSLVFRHSPD